MYYDVVECVVARTRSCSHVRLVSREWNEAYVRLVLDPRMEAARAYLDASLTAAGSRAVLLRTMGRRRVTLGAWCGGAVPGWVSPRADRCLARTREGRQCTRRRTHATTRLCAQHHARVPFLASTLTS